MGYARSNDTVGLTDDAVLRARYEIDIAGEAFAVTPHVKPPA
jgi:hypothetical protein